MTRLTEDRALLNELAEQARHWQELEELREQQEQLRTRSSTMNDPVTEYAIRVVYTPGQTGRITEYQHHLADARAAYDHAVSLHGEEAVEWLMRQVARSPWTPGRLPPPVHRDGGVLIPAPAAPPCGEMILDEKPIRDTASIDTYEEAQP